MVYHTYIINLNNIEHFETQVPGYMKICSACGLCYDDDSFTCREDATSLDSLFTGSPILDNRYKLERQLGAGGMGAVFQARHLEIEKVFALKIILPFMADQVQFLHRFKLEAQALGKLNHPNIVQVTDFGIDEREQGVPYLVMEFMRGTTLHELVEQKQKLSFDEAFPIFSQLAAGLDYAHENGIIHRDLKPKNIILVDQDKETATVKIIDFGIAQVGWDTLSDEIPEVPVPNSPRPELEEAATGEHFVLDEEQASSQDQQESGENLTSPTPPAPVTTQNTKPLVPVDREEAVTGEHFVDEENPAKQADAGNATKAAEDPLVPEKKPVPDTVDVAPPALEELGTAVSDATKKLDKSPYQSQFYARYGFDTWQSRLTRTGSIMGTLAYIAPEIAEKKSRGSRVSDIYSFGILGYEVLVGKCPFEGSAPALIYDHVFKEPPSPSTFDPEISPELDEAVLSALVKVPEERPPSGAAYVNRLLQAYQAANVRSWRADQLPKRRKSVLYLSLILICLMMVGYTLNALQFLENKLIDARFYLTAPQKPDARLILVSLQDDIMDRDKGDEMSAVLLKIFEAGAAGMAIDYLLHENWSKSKVFSQFVLKYSDRLVLAALSAKNDRILGTECLKGFTTMALGAEKASFLFGYVNLNEDSDGIVRRFKGSFNDTQGNSRNAFAQRAATLIQKGSLPLRNQAEPMWINYAVDWQENRLLWSEIIQEKLLLQRVKDKFVLIGGESDDYEDMHRVPHPASLPARISGVLIQGMIINSLISNIRLGTMSYVAGLVNILISVAFVLFFFLRWPQIKVLLVGAGGATAVQLLLAFIFFNSLKTIVPIAITLVSIWLLALALIVFNRYVKLQPILLPNGRVE